VELVERAGKAPIVAINWPIAATITTPATYDQVAATTMRLLANASTTLAALKGWRRL
jgi:hypothetical protein